MNEINMEWTFLIFLSPENNNRISRRPAGSAMSCLHNRESLREQAARKETYEINQMGFRFAPGIDHQQLARHSCQAHAGCLN